MQRIRDNFIYLWLQFSQITRLFIYASFALIFLFFLVAAVGAGLLFAIEVIGGVTFAMSGVIPIGYFRFSHELYFWASILAVIAVGFLLKALNVPSPWEALWATGIVGWISIFIALYKYRRPA